MDPWKTSNIATDDSVRGIQKGRGGNKGPVAAPGCIVRVGPEWVVVSDSIGIVPDSICRDLPDPWLNRLFDLLTNPLSQCLKGLFLNRWKMLF